MNCASMSPPRLEDILNQLSQPLPIEAPEALVKHQFCKPFLNALGYEDLEIWPEFSVGNGAVDYAARKNIDNNVFIHSGANPYVYLEAKGRTERLTEGHADYAKASSQLKQYLLAPQSKSVQWGILTNSEVTQVFRKHGKVVYPVTPCLSFEDVRGLVKKVKSLIEIPKRSLVIAVYNNKGGVGKTTTTLNLGATLALLKKRVLVIDFDPNQGDLGDTLNLPPTQGKLLGVLDNRKIDIREVITPYRFVHPRLDEPLSFDVVRSDQELVSDIDEVKLRQQVRPHALLKALEPIKDTYDYILIDAPPNWRIFSERAIYAADVVLIPARHNNLHSLQNAATSITKLIPQIQQARRQTDNAGPTVLPIFLNNAHRTPDAQMQLMHQAISQLIRESKREGFDLTPYFYPRLRRGHRDLRMMQIPYMAHIARSDFHHVPAAFAFRNAREQYLNLAKEYFVQ